jgi:hypothetical protein
VLELEDLSVDVVTLSLPEAELLPSDFELPVEEGALDIPEAALAVPGVEEERLGRGGGDITVEVLLGGGTRNHFLSEVSLYHFGESPEGKLLFVHESSDGFSGERPGTGFNERIDSLNGSIGFSGRRVNTQFEGSFEDREQGLQGQGAFYSKIDRRAGLQASVGVNEESTFSLRGGVDGSVTSRLLTQSLSAVPPAEKFTEYAAGIFLEGRLQYERFYLGISPRYRYRTGGPDDSYLLNRFELAGLFGVDVSPSAQIDGSVSWFWSEPSDHQVPFSLRLSIHPSDQFSFSLAGGYRIVRYDLWDVTTGQSYGLQPGTLEDDRGFYASLGTHYNLSRSWLVFGGLEYMDHTGILSPSETQDSPSGLFPVTQEEIQTLGAEAGVRWSGPANLSLLARLEAELLDRPSFTPGYLLEVEAGWKSGTERFGSTLSSLFYSGVNENTQLPVLDLTVFYRLSDNFMLSTLAHDLLAPALDQPRLAWDPFIEEGFRFTLRAHLTF